MVENESQKITARIPTKFGMVEIDGTQEAVQNILIGLGIGRSKKQKGVKTVKMLVTELITSGWLDDGRTLTEIRKELVKKGFNFRTSSIYPVLLREFIRMGIIERTGGKKSFLYYANPNKASVMKRQAMSVEEPSESLASDV
jgi:hypothetical protein